MSDEEKEPLKPANENPWYCLATVYGEQEGGFEGLISPFLDKNLAKRNRVAWNRWMAAALSQEQRAALVKKGFDEFELVPLNEEERAGFLETFAKRTSAVPPEPTEMPNYSNVYFERGVSFERCVFPTAASFTRAVFEHSAIFREAAFFGPAYFGEIACSSGTFFTGVAFFDKVSFSKATFSSLTVFDGAMFSGDANFYEAAFEHNALFQRATFSGGAGFTRASFLAFADTLACDFTACEFKSNTSFSGAVFLSHTPDFRDAKLPEATEWDDAKWPPPPEDIDAARSQIYAFERLKAEMERSKRHEDEQFFFAKELSARRALLWFKCRDGERAIGERAKSAIGWLLNAAYTTFSGYGLSIVRPLVWLIALFFLCAGVFAATASLDGGPMNLRQAAEFSVTNLFPFLPNKAGTDITGHLSIWTKYFGDLQSFLGVLLLFLLGLALRNRFRMK